jgi:hypothetical protein
MRCWPQSMLGLRRGQLAPAPSAGGVGIPSAALSSLVSGLGAAACADAIGSQIRHERREGKGRPGTLGRGGVGRGPQRRPGAHLALRQHLEEGLLPIAVVQPIQQNLNHYTLPNQFSLGAPPARRAKGQPVDQRRGTPPPWFTVRTWRVLMATYWVAPTPAVKPKR